MTRNQWLLIGGLGCATVVVFACLCSLLLTLTPPPTTPTALLDVVQQPTVLRPTATAVSTPTKPAAATTIPTVVRPTPTAVPAVGIRVVGTNWAITVEKVERMMSISPSFGKPVKAQGTFLILTVKLENISKRSILLNSWDFKIKDSQGREFSLSSDGSTALLGAGEPEVLWLTQEVHPSLSTRVRVVFDVAPDGTGLTLKVQDLPPIGIGDAAK